ncbi:hypothetical protein EHQ68_01200 [Leptospira congkakensis]|uniref:Uncharacterized protein n=1 Tax=Leptospira congkakensis TaxID=2484932 RepID=A0A4Z1AD72_9LEPT|nr:hypothetical protein [Leptospira congkakensis]TGL92458.1 hypothetical protein EHQ68_01200 [Leptospira congkakensis]TGL93218.1 hypothetical protein EHQ70_18390 [Leptospira congkakensis]TGL96237.1 hypothetical protein EHQ69_01945 [Leptospira congkakensis]
MKQCFYIFCSLFLIFSSLSADPISPKKGDRVEVYDAKEGKSFSGMVIKIEKEGFLIHYDGYADSYDEVVTLDRIKPMAEIPGVTFIKSEKGKSVTVIGNLKTGSIMDDLEWAEASSMACWPGIRNVEFEGNQIHYWTDLPKKSTLIVTVKPKNSKTRVNLYAFSGFDPKYIPPKVYGAVSCEASHPTWIGSPDFSKPAEPQTVELRAVGNPYRVFIGVSGAKNITEGDFELTLEVK